MRRRPGSPRSGFTLVEVMVTLLIMSLMLVAITQVLTGVRKTRDEIHNIQERQLAGPAILQRLERDLRAMFTYNRNAQELLRIRDGVQTGFDADTIDFVVTEDGLMPHRERASDPFVRADVNEIGYRLRPRPDSDDFLEMYRREDFGVDEAPFEGGHFALLHDRIKGFNIEVYEEDGPEAEPLDSWDDEDYLGIPTRIDVELTIEMAPRLVREQLVIERRTLTYRRTFRFPESLRRASGLQPVPRIPTFTPPADPSGLAAPTTLAEEGQGGQGGQGQGGTTTQTGGTANPFGGGAQAAGDGSGLFGTGGG